MDDKAIKLLYDYILEFADRADLPEDFAINIVWKCKTLQNYKYLLVTNLPDDRYYELTYNGDKREWYLDDYMKVVNRRVPASGV